MKFKSVVPINFLTLGDVGPIYLADRGLNLLQGVNEDDSSASSNGSGKSSIPDALCWCLYGKTARGESGDAVVNHKAKKDCSVTVELLDGATHIRVTRYRKHSHYKNALVVTLPATATDLTKGTDAETQVVVEEIMGCSYEVFKAAIYAGQEDMPDIPRMTDKALKVLIEEAAGVQRLEKAYEIARRQEGEKKALVEQCQTTLTRMKSQLHSLQVDLETAKLKHQEHEDTREGRAKAQDDAALAEQGHAREIVKQLQGLPKDTELQAQQEQLRQQIAQHTAKTAEVEKLQQPIRELEKRLLIERTEAQRLGAEVKRIRGVIDNAVEHMKQACKTCGKPHTEADLAQFKQAHEAQATSTMVQLQALVPKVREGDAQLAQLRQEHDRQKQALPDLSETIQRSGEIAAQLQEIGRLKNAGQAHIARAKAAAAQAAMIRSEPNPQGAVMEMLRDKIDAAGAQLSETQGTLPGLQAQLEVAQAVTKVFSPAGVRAHILDTVTPFLNEQTAEYLSTLSDGNITATWSTLSRTAKGELREKFCIEVEHAKGGKSFGLLSGGERRKVRLSCVLALQDLVASRATKPISLWMGDEIDDALDEPGLERLMTLLERKARERGTVLVISHNALADWVDAVTLVRKCGGQSTVEGALRESSAVSFA
jgi:DNA repair exonuclease SbcCD ATPase subunit